MAQKHTQRHGSLFWLVSLSDTLDSICLGNTYWIPHWRIPVKLIKGLWDKVVDVIDDMAAQLGLQPRPAPVRVKKNSDRKKK